MFMFLLQNVRYHANFGRQAVPHLRQGRSRENYRAVSAEFDPEELWQSLEHLHTERIQGHRPGKTYPAAGGQLGESAQDETRPGLLILL